MKSTIAAIALSMASAVYGQAVTDLPNCAVDCFVNILSNDGCSSLSDFECHCKKPGLVDSVTPCVLKACSVADRETVVKDVIALCQDYGVQLTIPATKTATVPSYSAPSPSSPAAPVNNNPASTTSTNPAGDSGPVVIPSSSPSSGGIVAPPAKSAPVVPYSSAVPSNSGNLIATIPIASSPIVVIGGGSTGVASGSVSRSAPGYTVPTPYKGTPTTPGVSQFTGAAASTARGVGAAMGVAAAFVAAVF